MPTIRNIREIHVTNVDNELYIIASNGNGSSEICHIKSGFDDPVNYKFFPPAILLTGEYDLIIIGINWARGPQGFHVSITGDEHEECEKPLIFQFQKEENPDAPVGANWSHVIHVTVESGGIITPGSSA
ncbi:hypothetical protein [Acidithiobacillus ferriphilus]|uniref:hypothetical protein n=1 Tax=Acidithiobacillus ferriphilus TaxID=1689834 RepID=UPI002DB84ABE|nr:hypothetical protein [Acidithiobacillus ferriphilus]MEB8537191.1 hypothetical protein [Acidithiobacillus ferriphilus]